jgi:hypothetical protein
MHIGCWWESQKERYHWEYQDIGGRLILKWVFRETEWAGMDWTDVAEDREHWRALVNVAMKLWIP